MMASIDRMGICLNVWTQNLGTARGMSAALEAGIIWVNNWFYATFARHWGMKSSSIGREGRIHSLDFYSVRKNVYIKL